jgi:hypothetical protein
VRPAESALHAGRITEHADTDSDANENADTFADGAARLLPGR